MRAIVRDRIQLIELVVAEAFCVQAAYPKTKTNDDQYGENDDQQSAI